MEVKESDFKKLFDGNGTQEEFLNILEGSTESLLEQINVLKDATKLAIDDKSIKLYKGYKLEQLQMELILASNSLYRVVEYKRAIERDLNNATEENISL